MYHGEISRVLYKSRQNRFCNREIFAAKMVERKSREGGKIKNYLSYRFYYSTHNNGRGGNLLNHYNANALSEIKLREQYLKNEEHLKQFPNYVQLFSYPYGAPGSCFSNQTNDILKSLGVKVAFSSYPINNQFPLNFILDRYSFPQEVVSSLSIEKYLWETFIYHSLRRLRF